MAKAGQDFATLVENYSDDPSSRKEGGVLGSFPMEKLTPEFRRALDGLDVGGVAAPVRGTAGFFILRLDSRDEPRVLPYEEVKDTVRSAVEEQKIEEELKGFIAELRERFYIDIKA
jgi:parvulin-like peptidyl-prolyl isomerase